MTEIRCLIAKTREQLDDALLVRWKVFGQEMRLLELPTPRVPREINAFDTLRTTIHFLAYADGEPIATVRLLLPNPEVARESGQRLGIDLEGKFDLSLFETPGVSLAETTRLCVLKEWRRSRVGMQLQAEMHKESWRHGVTHWVASANTETDSMEDALLVHRVAGHLGLLSERFGVKPRAQASPPAAPRFPFYRPEERRRAHQGDLAGLRLPGTLSVFAHSIGARFTGEPIYDPHFRMCSMPFVASLAEQSASRTGNHDGPRQLRAA